MPDEFIRQWGDPALHERDRPVAALDDLLRRQIARMRERLRVAEGAGLAATQIGILRRMFVYRLRPEDPIEVLVNPEIVGASSERAVFLEGCLSFNTVVVSVERAVSVRIRGGDLDGRVTIQEYDGFGASLVQHELEHLDGILTLDRATLEERRRATALLVAGAAAQAA